MNLIIARVIVRLAAWIVPARYRDRWHEEWLAEIDAAERHVLRLAIGAPRDAWLSRWTMREPSGWRPTGWLTDLRDAWRALRRTPLQTATILLCLTIGSTLTIVMFGVVNAALGGSLPGVRDRPRIVRLAIEDAADRRLRGLTMGEFRRLPSDIPGLESFAGELSWRFSASIAGEAISVDGRFVSGTYFKVLGTTPVCGRLIEPADDGPGAAPVALLGHALWRRQFGSDAGVVGQVIRIGTATYRVIGVLPPQFVGVDSGDFGEVSEQRAELWLPMGQMLEYPGFRGGTAERAIGPRLVGRIAPRLTVGDAEAQAEHVGAIVASAADAAQPPLSLRLRPFVLLPMSDPGEVALFVTILMSVPLIVLGIACANVAGVQLARAVGRTHEIAIRVGLGASRGRVARMLVVETALVAVVAGAMAWFIAGQALRLAGAVLPFGAVADGRLLLFAMLLPLGVTLVAGFAPAWRATGFDVLSGLRQGPRVGRSASPRVRRAVVVCQLALSVLLLTTATFLIHSIESLPLSIGPLHDDVLTASISFDDLGFDAARQREARAQIVQAVAALPGVTDVAVSTSPLLARTAAGAMCWTSADPSGLSVRHANIATTVTPGFFRTVNVGVRQGRTFDENDRDGVVVVNEAFVATLPPESPAVGAIVRARRLMQSPAGAAAAPGPGAAVFPVQIIGVVEDSYERIPRGAPRPRCYLPIDPLEAGGFAIVARSPKATALVPVLRGVLAGIDLRLSPREIGSVADLVRARYSWLYALSSALTIVSAIALLLAAVGLFAVMSNAVSQRTGEFGVRLALGARPRDITSGVVREALVMTSAGTAIGVVAAIPVASVLGGGVLSSISWRDPAPAIIVASILIVVGLVATFMPAWRVSRLDPVRALRQE